MFELDKSGTLNLLKSKAALRSYRKKFLMVFTPLLLLLFIAMGLILMVDIRSQKTILIASELSKNKLLNQAVRDELRIISSDIYYLANLPQLRDYLDKGGKPPATLVENLTLFSEHRKIYDQIRYLDLSGMEIIRINIDGKKSVPVPENQLQSKRKRYYFEDSVRLDRGGVYVSQLDLNIERNSIEYPLKPMIRFGIPVFDSKGHKRGVIVLNYLGNEMLSLLDRHSAKDGSTITLLNSDGYWLKGMRADDEWGFMYPDRKDYTIEKQFPGILAMLRSNQDGQIINEKGFFAFSTIYPLRAGQESAVGNSAPEGSSSARLKADGYYWKLVNYMPPEMVNQKLYGLRNLVAVFSASMVVLLYFLSRQIAYNIIQKEATTELVHSMAFEDPLTGLPNRRLMEDRLEQAIALAERNSQRLAILFMDIDHFKKINDSFGHKAGDKLLVMVAERLLAEVRKSDTLARLGGDEFIIVLNNIGESSSAEEVAQKIITLFSQPFDLTNESIIVGTSTIPALVDGADCAVKVQVGTSIGISVYPDDAPKGDNLVQLADHALYMAKQKGRNCFVRYGAEAAG